MCGILLHDFTNEKANLSFEETEMRSMERFEDLILRFINLVL